MTNNQNQITSTMDSFLCNNAYLLGGFFAGISGVVAGYPIDTVKVRIQSGTLDLDHGRPKSERIDKVVEKIRERYHIRHKEKAEMLNCERKLEKLENRKIRFESTHDFFKSRPHPSSYLRILKYSYFNGNGLKILYKGVGPPIASLAPANAIAFYVEHSSLQKINSLYEKDEDKDTALNHTFAGAISGATQAFINGPTELIKTQMQVRLDKNYKNSLACARHIVKRHGVSKLSKGLGVTFLREVPAFGIYFGMHHLALDLMEYDPDESKWEEIKPFLSGGLAGMTSWYINYPIDCIKTRMQSVPITENYTIRRGYEIVRDEGNWKYDMALRTSGMRATLIRAFICNSVTFGTLSIFLKSVDAYKRKKQGQS